MSRFKIIKENQTISFDNISDKALENSPFNLTATASSGLPVKFSVLEGSGTLEGNTITLTGIGSVSIKAEQQGNEFYNAAEEVTRTFTVLDALGIEDDLATNIKIYPVPTSDLLFLKTEGEKVKSANLLDINGSTIKKANFSSSSDGYIDLNGMKKGMYYIRIETLNGSSTRKIIVE